MRERLASLDRIDVVYKCESKKHITMEQDLAYHEHLLSKGDPKPELDHAGCEVHKVLVTPGSPPVSLPPCRKCGGTMVRVSAVEPRYVSLPCNEAGVIELADLLKAIDQHHQETKQ